MYITTNKELKQFCQKLQKAKFISIDTEFIRRTTYYSQLCLIQIADDKDICIIDGLNPTLNLCWLNDILQNPSITKVFHSAKQDLEIFFHLNGTLPQNIFDTQIAASFCGLGDSISYEMLVERLLNIKIDKSYCISDWTRRPLLQEQLDYAITDVTYLYQLYPKLIDKLIEIGRLAWAEEENSTAYKIENFKINPETIWRKLKNTENNKIDLVTKKLAFWRELKAQQFNLPRNHYLNEKYIFQLAKNKPISLEELQNIQYFAQTKEGEAEEIISIIQSALQQQIEMDLASNQIFPEINYQLLNQLKNMLRLSAEKHSLTPSFIATVEELKELAIINVPINTSSRIFNGWRKEVFGDLILKFLK